MKIIPFPTGGQSAQEAREIAELEAAMGGTEGPGTEAWRELSSDIRALAPPIDQQFEVALYERLSDAPDTSMAVRDSQGPTSRPPRVWQRWKSRPLTPRLLSLSGAGALAAILITIVLVGPLTGKGSRPIPAPVTAGSQSTSAAARGGGAAASGAAQPKTVPPDVAAASATPSPAAGASPVRVQQLGASLTLAGTPEEVQKLADGVSRVVIAEGGYVSSSQVQVERGASNSATLVVSVPSSRLSRTLAALGRLGPVRAETQSLQDITSTYDSDRSALEQAVAERSALLRALARASSQGEIESLHRRLGIVGGAIERTRAAFARISSQADNASLEVTVLGEAHPAGSSLTLKRGLHDAGRVLTVALAVLLIGLAGLVPLLAVGFAVALALRALRRAARERALRGG